MKRRDFLKVSAAGAAATAVASPAIAQSSPEMKWRLTSSFPKSLDTIYGGAEYLAEAGRRDDRQQVPDPGVRRRRNRARPAGARRDVERHRRDVPHRARTTTSARIRPSRSSPAVPFGLNARQQNSWLYQGGGNELAQRVLQEVQRRSASPAATPAPRWAAGSARRSRPSPTCRGLKMRIGGIAGQVLQKLGVVPQQIAGGDIYPALEKGTIDAAEWVGPYDDEKLGFHKVAPYYYYPGFWEGGPTRARLRQSREVERAAEELSGDRSPTPRAHANTWMQARYDMQNPAALKRLVAGGTQLRPFSTGGAGRLPARRPTSSAPRSRPRTPTSRRSIDAMQAYPLRPVSVVAGRRIHLRQLHDPLAHPRLIAEASLQTSARPPQEAGLLCRLLPSLQSEARRSSVVHRAGLLASLACA